MKKLRIIEKNKLPSAYPVSSSKEKNSKSNGRGNIEGNECIQRFGVGLHKFIVLNGLNSNDSSKEELASSLFSIFDKEWPKKCPIVFRNTHTRLNQSLWTPESFAQYYGHLTVDLINCGEGDPAVIKNATLDTFWKGFENKAGSFCFF